MFVLHTFVRDEFTKATRAWHDRGLEHFDWLTVSGDFQGEEQAKRLSMKLHWANYQIWHYEDYCRSGIDIEIIRCKPQIDKHNQLRNDFIEQLDEYLINEQLGGGIYNTETLGSIIDRISILALKVYHWNELLEQGKKEKFRSKYLVAVDQHAFLVNELASLLADIRQGKRQMRLFRQLKMYNNLETNPKMQANGQSQASNT